VLEVGALSIKNIVMGPASLFAVSVELIMSIILCVALQMSEEKLLDPVELESITGGDIKIKQELLSLFLNTIPYDVDTLQRYIKRELRMEAEIQAHTMKGVARSIAANKVILTETTRCSF
jgi:hypothetical protein